MKCERVKDIILADYYDNRLSAADAEVLEKHVDKCHSCRSFLKTAVEINSILKKAERRPVPDHLYNKILLRIEKEAHPSLINSLWDRRVLAPALSFAAAALLAIGTYFFGVSGRIHPSPASNGLEPITYLYDTGNGATHQDSEVNFESAAEEFFL